MYLKQEMLDVLLEWPTQ